MKYLLIILIILITTLTVNCVAQKKRVFLFDTSYDYGVKTGHMYLYREGADQPLFDTDFTKKFEWYPYGGISCGIILLESDYNRKFDWGPDTCNPCRPIKIDSIK